MGKKWKDVRGKEAGFGCVMFCGAVVLIAFVSAGAEDFVFDWSGRLAFVSVDAEDFVFDSSEKLDV